jgi:hypothetical protein
MALGENTQARIEAVYPNSYHLLPELEEACSALKTQREGRGHVEFTAQGIDACGKLIVKWIDAGLRFFCRKDEESESRKR